jgi:alkylhydroperoxidase family enzyme
MNLLSKNGNWIDAVKMSLPEHVGHLERNLDIVMTQHGLDEIDAHCCALAAAIAAGNGELAFEISVNGPLFGCSERELVTQAVVSMTIDSVYLDYLTAVDIAEYSSPKSYALEVVEPIMTDETGKAAAYAFAAAITLKHSRTFALVELLKEKNYSREQVQDIANIASVIASINKIVI